MDIHQELELAAEDEKFVQEMLSSEDDGDNQLDRKHGGSRPGRQPNKEREYDKRYDHLMKQYFVDKPIYNDVMFRRRFRMSKRLFDKVYHGVLQADGYFEQRQESLASIH